MKILIDTNLLFSSVTKPDGLIAEIILNPKFEITFYGCYFSYIELFKHKSKMLQISKLDEIKMLEALYQILKRITFINEETISKAFIENAYNLTKDVDAKDTIFVAMADFLGCKLWSGDLKLINGLRQKGYDNILKTDELLELISI